MSDGGHCFNLIMSIKQTENLDLSMYYRRLKIVAISIICKVLIIEINHKMHKSKYSI